MIFLSTSVCSPTISNSISFPSFLDTSNTIRFIFWKVFVSGTIRMDMITFCRSVEIFDSWDAALLKLFKLSPGTLRSGFCSTTDSEMTSSPISSISWSILLTFTLMKDAFSALGLSFASFFCLPGSLDLITKSPGVIFGFSDAFSSSLLSICSCV